MAPRALDARTWRRAPQNASRASASSGSSGTLVADVARNADASLPRMIQLEVNQKRVEVDVDPSMPLLWVLRDVLDLTGTKYGCGMALCGACTVHVDGEARRSCVLPVSAAVGKKVTTIEGLSGDLSHPLQRAWIEEDVPQCGYCQSGQLMCAAVLLRDKPNPTDEDIDACMSGNLCRCGTYVRIRRAIQRAAGTIAPPAELPPASPRSNGDRPKGDRR
jgi:isoquinoline 1-oxidoreductase alpha subunit